MNIACREVRGAEGAGNVEGVEGVGAKRLEVEGVGAVQKGWRWRE